MPFNTSLLPTALALAAAALLTGAPAQAMPTACAPRAPCILPLDGFESQLHRARLDADMQAGQEPAPDAIAPPRRPAGLTGPRRAPAADGPAPALAEAERARTAPPRRPAGLGR